MPVEHQPLRVAQEKIETERLRAEKARKDAEEKVRIEKETEDRKEADEKAIAEKKAQNKNHQAVINNQIMDAFIALDIQKDTAKKIIIAVALGKIPNMRIIY